MSYYYTVICKGLDTPGKITHYVDFWSEKEWVQLLQQKEITNETFLECLFTITFYLMDLKNRKKKLAYNYTLYYWAIIDWYSNMQAVF